MSLLISTQPKKSTKRCSYCKKKKRSVRRRLNPYEDDLNGKKVYQNLCAPCVRLMADEL